MIKNLQTEILFVFGLPFDGMGKIHFFFHIALQQKAPWRFMNT
jgi:hypothetical protein